MGILVIEGAIFLLILSFYPPCHSTSALSSIQLSLLISLQRKLDDLFTRNIYPFLPSSLFLIIHIHGQMNDSSLEGVSKWGSATPKWKELNCNMIDTIKSVQVSSFPIESLMKRERESSHHILLIVFFSSVTLLSRLWVIERPSLHCERSGEMAH